jgi:hypothetical protein
MRKPAHGADGTHGIASPRPKIPTLHLHTHNTHTHACLFLSCLGLLPGLPLPCRCYFTEDALTIPAPEGARAGESFQRYMLRAGKEEVTAFFLGVGELLRERGIGQSNQSNQWGP